MTIHEIERLVWLRAVVASGEAQRVRERVGASLAEMADTCEVHASTIWRWERGLRVPRGVRALKYAHLLDRLGRSTMTSS